MAYYSVLLFHIITINNTYLACFILLSCLPSDNTLSAINIFLKFTFLTIISPQFLKIIIECELMFLLSSYNIQTICFSNFQAGNKQFLFLQSRKESVRVVRARNEKMDNAPTLPLRAGRTGYH